MISVKPVTRRKIKCSIFKFLDFDQTGNDDKYLDCDAVHLFAPESEFSMYMLSGVKMLTKKGLHRAIRRLLNAKRPARMIRLVAGVAGVTAAVALAHSLVLSSQAAPAAPVISFKN